MNIFNLAGLRPILNSLKLGGVHLQSIFREDEAKVFDRVFRKTTFIWMGIQTIFMETAEDLADMFLMICRVIGINEDVV